MVKRKRLPNAREIWAAIPLPALARKQLRCSRMGIYTFRVTQGMDLFGKPLFKVETRNIFGLLDDFCELYTEDFQTKEDAFSFYETCKTEAKKEYARLQQKQAERIENYGK